ECRTPPSPPRCDRRTPRAPRGGLLRVPCRLPRTRVRGGRDGARSHARRRGGLSGRSTERERRVSYRRVLWLRRGEHRAHHLRVAPPAAGLVAERFSTGDGEAVELRFAVGVGQSPLFFEQASPLEAMERGVKRAFFEVELVVRRLADPPADGVAVHRPPARRFEDDEIERSG